MTATTVSTRTFSPWKYVDVDFGYRHSVHFQLDTLSFSVGFKAAGVHKGHSDLRVSEYFPFGESVSR